MMLLYYNLKNTKNNLKRIGSKETTFIIFSSRKEDIKGTDMHQVLS